MKNREVSHHLNAYADLLQAHGGDPYRVRAYRIAAQTVASLPQAIEELDRQGLLGRLPGIGSRLKARIHSLIESGTFPEYEALRSEVSPFLKRLLSIPGLPIQTVAELHALWNRYGFEVFEAMLRSHLLRSLPGINRSVEEDLLEALHAFRKGASV